MEEGVAPILTSGGHQGYPSTNQDPKAKGGIEPDLPDDTHKATSLPSKDPTPPQPSPSTQALVLMQPLSPTHGFSGVMACLHAPELVEVELEAPVGLMPIGLLVAPGISSVTLSHIVKDKLMGITYMDTVTTSVGRVTISGPGLEAFPSGPTIEDITDSQ